MDYVGQQPAGTSDYIPLTPVGGASFDQIKLSWHMLSSVIGSDGDGQPSNLAPSPALMPLINQNSASTSSWSKQGYPAYLRVQLYGYPSSGVFDRASLTQRSRTVLLVPSTTGVALINFGTADASPGTFDSPKIAPSQVACNNSFTNYGSYLCSATLALPAGLPSTGNAYFLKVTPIYGQSHFRVQMYNSSTNSVVNFYEVQPIVDATGRASDVYRRLQARVRVNAVGNLPEYVTETAQTICKVEEVSSDPAYYKPNNCP